MFLLLMLVTSVIVTAVDQGPSTSTSSCITRDIFGSYKVPEKGDQELPVHRFTLTSPDNQVSVQVIEYGATITSIMVADFSGHVEDIILGYDTLEGFFSSDNPYFGATVGRVANRIGGGQFILDGVTHKLFRNIGNDTLHGGKIAFDKKLWSGRMEDGHLVMDYTSADGEEGFPGQVNVTVTYSLSADNTLIIEYKATTTKRTPINLTNHAYFNLAGHGAGAEALYNHTITIRADYITETDSASIPTGKLMPVAGTEFDLKLPLNLGSAIKRTVTDGFDNNFVLPQDRTDVNVAVVEEPSSRRRLEVRTTQPGLQFYTSNSISTIRGKAVYTRHAALCLEAQNFPDAVNHENFPNSVYGPGDIYHQIIKYKFGISPENQITH